MSLPAIPVALQIATAVASIGAQVAAQRQQSAAYKAQGEATTAAAISDYGSMQSAAIQEREAASQKLEENAREARAAGATAETAAGEAGVSGLSVDALMRDIMGTSARYQDSVQRNLDARLGQIKNEMTGRQMGAQASLNNRQAPSTVDYITPIASAGLGIYDTYDRFRIRPEDT